MLIYYSTAGDTVIIVFLNVVVHQKRLLSIRNTCKAILLACCLCEIDWGQWLTNGA